MIGIALGGNELNSDNVIHEAAEKLSAKLTNAKHSSLFKTKALGPGTRDFFNSVLLAKDTEMSLIDLWQYCCDLEKSAGRQKNNEIIWGDRVLDIDLIFFHELIKVSPIILPHPQMHRREFVLEPLQELCPNWLHPVLNLRVSDFLAELEG